MKHLILLLLTIAHSGNWIGGHTETISISWPLESGLPASTLNWDCKLGSISLAHGSVEMPDAMHPATLKFAAPTARTVTRLRFVYELVSKQGSNSLSSGETIILVYPPEGFSDLSQEYAGKRIALLDPSKSLRTLIEKSGATVDTIPDLSHIAMKRPDLLMIGQDQWNPSPFGQLNFESLARCGTQIIIFRQSGGDHLAGYHIARREPARGFIWNTDHPLLDSLDAGMLNAWANQSPAMAIRLPTSEPALPIGYWKSETSAGAQPPIDALLVSKAVGAGRIILCQLPAGDWDSDPRSQILLHNLLAYAMTLPEPVTIQPTQSNQRMTIVQAPLSRERNIAIPAGAEP